MPTGKKRGGRKKGSRNKQTADVKALARVYCPDAIRVLAAIMSGKTQPAAARVAAAKELLDRGYGKPAQALTGPDGKDLSLTIKKIVDVIVTDAPPGPA